MTIGGGEEEDEQPSLPCVKPTEPSRRSGWHVTCVEWLQAHRRQEQKWHPWSSYLLDTSVWKLWNSFPYHAPPPDRIRILKSMAFQLSILQFRHRQGRDIIWEHSRRENPHSDVPPHPWVHCMASCRSSSDCVLFQQPLFNRLPTEPHKTRHNTASFPFSLSLSFSLLSRMSWNELSGLMKSFTFLKASAPPPPKKEKKQKKKKEKKEKKTKRRPTFRKDLLLLNLPWNDVERSLSDPFCQWARTHSYICPRVLNLLRGFRVSCRWEEREPPPRSSLGASKSSSSAILTPLSLLLSGFIVVSRRLKCEI